MAAVGSKRGRDESSGDASDAKRQKKSRSLRAAAAAAAEDSYDTAAERTKYEERRAAEAKKEADEAAALQAKELKECREAVDLLNKDWRRPITEPVVGFLIQAATMDPNAGCSIYDTRACFISDQLMRKKQFGPKKDRCLWDCLIDAQLASKRGFTYLDYEDEPVSTVVPCPTALVEVMKENGLVWERVQKAQKFGQVSRGTPFIVESPEHANGDEGGEDGEDGEGDD